MTTAQPDLAILDFAAFQAQLCAEQAANEGMWVTEKTEIPVNPKVMLDIEIQNKKSPIHRLKGCSSLSEMKKCLEGYKRILESDSAEQRDALLQELKEQFAGTPCEQDPATTVLQLYENLFCKYLEVYRHCEFPDEMFMVKLDFFPESFFHDESNESHVFNSYYTACQQGDDTLAPEMATSPMRFCNYTAKNGHLLHPGLTFHGPQFYTEELKSLFARLLHVYAHMPGHSEFKWATSFLYTIYENQQDPHVDYRQDTLKMYSRRKRARRLISTAGVPTKLKFPWSLDMPLQSGGMRLAFYGTEEGVLKETPIVVHIPFRHALFWRGDCVHAGCLADLLGGHGFRMHAYLPLEEDQCHMMQTVRPEIEWRDKEAKRYAQRLKRFDGSAFKKGNERYVKGGRRFNVGGGLGESVCTSRKLE